MAIARGAGTEIIRTVMYEEYDDTTPNPLIFGVQHHIYTVLNLKAFASSLNAAGDWILLGMYAYDTNAGITNQWYYIFRQDMQVNQTFVWNDKFSFNGHEPVDFTAGLDSIAKQDAIADQGSAVPQKLMFDVEHASDDIDVTCTFIDQNNA